MSDAKVTFWNADWEDPKPGEEMFFNFECPIHKGRRCEGLAIRGRVDGSGPTWTWDGNRERPTFSPSINHTTCWHGFIENGRCVSTAKTDEPEPV